MAIAITVGLLIAGGVFMILRRGMVRIVVGFLLLSHAVNLFYQRGAWPAAIRLWDRCWTRT